MYKLPKKNYLLFETGRYDDKNFRSFLFFDPVDIIECFDHSKIQNSFKKIENYISKGYYAAGFLSYEAGFAFEPDLINKNMRTDFPLLWFGIYKKPENLPPGPVQSFNEFAVKNLNPDITEKAYIKNINSIKKFIQNGNTYQVNYTFKYKFNLTGDPFVLYNYLKERQKVSYSAFIRIPKFTLISVSPELFFRKNGREIEMKPMKGTFQRGRYAAEDIQNAESLASCAKNRSENVMIVDLLRNDLSRICEAGSVKTSGLFEVEEYETLLQMVSTVRGRLKKEISFYDLFKNIFPSGSITGAPKISTMRIINRLEKEQRKIYTGSIGFISPEGDAVFNVAIRTLLINNKTLEGEMGAGSGIVIDSSAEKEFEECMLKAKFLVDKPKEFSLIETILWQKKTGYFLLKYHLDRMESSAKYFNFLFKKENIIKKLEKLEHDFIKTNKYKIRLLLHKNGNFDIETAEIFETEKNAKARFSKKVTDSKDVFLYHKTTIRELYNSQYNQCRKEGYFDIIFTNEKKQVTEGAVTNIIIKKGKYYYTPPVKCGLLKGVFLKDFCIRKKCFIKEKILYREDILGADEVYMVNSVRGMIKVDVDK